MTRLRRVFFNILSETDDEIVDRARVGILVKAPYLMSSVLRATIFPSCRIK